MEISPGIRFWTKQRTRRVAGAVFLSLLAAHVIVFLSDTAETSSVRRGDFPAFYAAALIAASNQPAQLYDQSVQSQIENLHWPSLKGRYLSFAYPPFVAALLSPLSWFSPLAAKCIFTLFLFLCLVFSVRMILLLNPNLSGNGFLLLAIFFSFGPILSGFAAAQNVAVSMLCYSAAMYYLLSGRSRGTFTAGLVLGLWLFKPNFALFALLPLVVLGHFGVLLGTCIPALVYYLLGTRLLGFSWPAAWIQAASEFSARDFPTNQFQMVSIFGVTNALRDALHEHPIWANIGTLCGALIALYVLVLTLKALYEVSTEKDSALKKRAFEHLLYLLGPAIVLLSPHTLYYDLGLCLIPLARYVRLRTDRQVLGFVTIIFLMFLFTLTRDVFAVQPMFLFALACFVFVYRTGKILPVKPE